MFPLLLKKIEIKNLELNDSFLCFVCNKLVNEKDNLGKLDCSYHPGEIIMLKNQKPILSCCFIEFKLYHILRGVDVNTLEPFKISNLYGCTRCDHIPVDATYNDKNDIILLLDEDVIQNFNSVLNDACNVNYMVTNKISIRRYDPRYKENCKHTQNNVQYWNDMKTQNQSNGFLDIFDKDCEEMLSGTGVDKSKFTERLQIKKKEIFKKYNINYYG